MFQQGGAYRMYAELLVLDVFMQVCAPFSAESKEKRCENKKRVFYQWENDKIAFK